MPRTEITAVDDDADLGHAMDVWHRARAAVAGSVPGPARTERVARKVAAGPVTLLARYGAHPAGMLVAEPFLEEGRTVDDTGHISMVFVDPSRWGSGIGGALVHALQDRRFGPGWRRLSVWTRETNRRGQRLYLSRGFVDTGERAALHEGEIIVRLEWSET